MSDDPADFLTSGPTVESTHPAVVDFASAHAGQGSQLERAVRLYYAVRDGFRYDPYSSALSVQGLKATKVLNEQRGWCVSKAILLAACCRAQSIPARLGFADVRNHMSTEKMRQRMQTDLFYWHGYTDIHLNGTWVKATPAFNIELCEKFGLHPLEFDGSEDSIYHPFDVSGNRHMEYVNYRGTFAEPPVDAMLATFQEFYPHWRDRDSEPTGDFEAEVDREVENERAGLRT